jgi:ComF family protein
LKFRRLDYLAEELVDAALELSPPTLDRDVDLVVPVPLGALRRLGRGFNQAERIARRLARRLGLPVAAAIARRHLWSTPQSRLGRVGRAARLDRRFRPAREANACRGARLLLVDDVVTTGATLRSAAGILERCGAATIMGWALAATPRLGREIRLFEIDNCPEIGQFPASLPDLDTYCDRT